MSDSLNNNIKQKAFYFLVWIIKVVIKVFAKDKSESILGQFVEELTPIVHQKTPYGKLDFYCPGRLPTWRAKTLLIKEPETIAWINTFSESEVFWDIGANIGIYSLYSALRKIKVVSFEPAPGNYYLLCRNIELNKMNSNISALCLAFSDNTKLDSFYMTNTELGSALNSFGEALNWQGKPYSKKEVSIKQAMLGFRIDDYILQFNPPFPNHIKIDVDGNEDKIVEGAIKVLSDTRLKSLLIELDTERTGYYQGVMKLITGETGLKLEKKEHSPIFDKGRFSHVYNHIFSRV